MLVLKRLSDAVRDGDPIRAVARLAVLALPQQARDARRRIADDHALVLLALGLPLAFLVTAMIGGVFERTLYGRGRRC